jgi:hypothetical protein
MIPGTTKLLVAIQRMVDATASEENNHRTLIVSGPQLEDLLRMVTVLAVPAEAAVALVTAMQRWRQQRRELITRCWQECWWRQ